MNQEEWDNQPINVARKRLSQVMEEIVTEVNRTARENGELPLRIKQLGEIRAMLRLPVNASHQAVCSALYALGQAGQAIDLSAMPERYK